MQFGGIALIFIFPSQPDVVSRDCLCTSWQGRLVLCRDSEIWSPGWSVEIYFSLTKSAHHCSEIPLLKLLFSLDFAHAASIGAYILAK